MPKTTSFQKEFLGTSDTGTLLLAGPDKYGELSAKVFYYGEGGKCYGYIVNDSKIDFGERYTEVARFKDWLKIYDDYAFATRKRAKEIIVLRSPEGECVIQLIR